MRTVVPLALAFTPFVLKAVADTLKKHAIFNSSLDEVANEVILKEYVHLGIAVDTDQGLMVPVIRDVDKKSMFDLAKELESLAAKARDDPDFWSVVGLTELRIYLAIADHKLASELDTVLREFDDLYTRVSAPSEWSSVLDQLRFVLPKYAARATTAEKKAVERLTTHLQGRARTAAGPR